MYNTTRWYTYHCLSSVPHSYFSIYNNFYWYFSTEKWKKAENKAAEFRQSAYWKSSYVIYKSKIRYIDTIHLSKSFTFNIDFFNFMMSVSKQMISTFWTFLGQSGSILYAAFILTENFRLYIKFAAAKEISDSFLYICDSLYKIKNWSYFSQINFDEFNASICSWRCFCILGWKA